MTPRITVTLPPRVRLAIYWCYALTGIGLGATQVAYATAQAPQPIWLTVAIAVTAYLGIALGVVAATNVNPDREIQYIDAENVDWDTYAEREEAQRGESD